MTRSPAITQINAMNDRSSTQEISERCLIIVDAKRMYADMMREAFLMKTPDFDVQTVSCVSSALPLLTKGTQNAILLSEHPHYYIRDATRDIYKTDADAKIILLDQYPSPCGIFLATTTHGYWTQNDSHEDMIREVGCVLNGFTSLSPEAEHLLRHPDAPTFGLHKLTRREFQCFAHVARFENVKRCADDLGISHRTVEKYKARVLKKFAVHSIADLNHLISPDATSTKGRHG